MQSIITYIEPIIIILITLGLIYYYLKYQSTSSKDTFTNILAPANLKAGDVISSGEQAPIAVGNCLPLKNIPVGTVIHAVELRPGKGAQMLRSAGASGQLLDL